MEIIKYAANGHNSNKHSGHEVDFKKDGHPTVRIGFIITGNYTIKQGREKLHELAEAIRKDRGFDKFKVLH